VYERPTFGSLFAGIGGIDLGLERAGWTGRFQVEYEPFCQRVLAKHWPDVHRVGDVHDAHGAAFCPNVADAHAGGRDGRTGEQRPAGWREPADGCPNCLPYVDLLAGGFPCQPVSFAGRRQIQNDDRWLWPEFARCIRELRPRYVLVENVPGLLLGGGMDDVLGGLAQLGYDTEWESIPAAAVGAPHLRYRVWIIGTRVAYPDSLGQGRTPTLGSSRLAGSRPQGAGAEPHGAGAGAGTGTRSDWARDEAVALAERGGSPGPGQPGQRIDPAAHRDGQVHRTIDAGWWSSEPDVGRVAHGVPARVDRLRALGNAVVPQVVEFIGRRILEAEAEAVA
jgi:DNA (cytosine-5)-methyltransferase 1